MYPRLQYVYSGRINRFQRLVQSSHFEYDYYHPPIEWISIEEVLYELFFYFAGVDILFLQSILILTSTRILTLMASNVPTS